MLERVAQGQTRFATPGISVDPRGIALGRLGVMLFPALDGVVGWLRVYSDEAGLDELLSGMKIVRLRTPLASRAFALVIPAASSYVLDKASRCARLVGGTTFTGSQRHFVRYRDERSPYGYDVVDPAAPPQGAELVLHGEDASQPYANDGELDVRTLILRLSLVRVPGAERLDAEGRADLYLTVPRGLSSGVTRYLWRNRVQAEVALVTLAKKSEFTDGETGYFVARVRELPARLLEGFRGIPGVTVYRPVADNVIVEVGWRHPIELSSCAALFERDKLYLFSGQRDGVDVVAGPVELVDARHLTELKLDLANPRERAGAPEKAAAVGVVLKLASSLAPPRRVVGTLIPWAEASRLKKLVYALPPATLRGHRVAATDRGILLHAVANVDVVPLGTLLAELAPGLLIPVGMELVPRVANEVLAQALGHGTGKLTIFPHEGTPFFLEEGALAPLERRALAQLDVAQAAPVAVALPPPAADPRVVNDPVGAFALWGYPAPSRS